MGEWTVILLAGAGTYALRASLIVGLGRVEVPPVVERAFSYVGPAVLAAVALPALLAPAGSFDPTTLRVPVAAVAALVAWRTGSIPAALVAGFGVHIGLSLLA